MQLQILLGQQDYMEDYCIQDTALFVVNKLKEKSFELKDLQKFITDEIEKTHKQIDESRKKNLWKYV